MYANLCYDSGQQHTQYVTVQLDLVFINALAIMLSVTPCVALMVTA